MFLNESLQRRPKKFTLSNEEIIISIREYNLACSQKIFFSREIQKLLEQAANIGVLKIRETIWKNNMTYIAVSFLYNILYNN